MIQSNTFTWLNLRHVLLDSWPWPQRRVEIKLISKKNAVEMMEKEKKDGIIFLAMLS